MAISSSDIGLLFKIKADSSAAKTEVTSFKTWLLGEARVIEGSVNGMTGSLGKLAGVAGLGGVTLAAVGAGAALYGLANHAAKFADGLVDLNAKTNLSIESLSVLKENTAQTDVNFHTIANSLVLFQKNLIKAQEGNDGLSQRFKVLGVDLNGGVEPALKKTFAALNSYADGAAKTKLATDLFGRSGADVLVVLKQMGGDLDKATEAARKLGLVVSSEDAKAADDFKDQIKLLHQTMEGFTFALGKSIIPEVNNFAKALTSVVGWVNKLTEAIGGLKGIASGAIRLNFEITGIPGLARAINGGGSGGTLYDKPAGPELTGRDAPIFPGGAGGGEKDLSAIKLHIKQMESLQKEAERNYQLATDELKQQQAERLISQEEYAEKSIALEKQLLQAKLEALAAEEEEAKRINLPNKRAAELLKIQDKEKAARQEFIRAIGDIDQEQAKRESEDDAAFAAMKKKAYEENKKALLEFEDFVIEQYRREADAYYQRQKLAIEFYGSFYANRKTAIQRLAALEVDHLEAQYERNKQDVERELKLLAEQTGADEEEQDRLVGRRKALNDRLVALEAEKEAAIRLLKRQALIDQQREQPNSNLNTLGPGINDALNSLEAGNAVIGKQTTLWEKVGTAMRAYVDGLKNNLPTALQVVVQSMQAVAAATSASITAFLTGHASLRQAIGSIIDAMLAPYKRYAEIKAAIQFAEAAGDFAYGNFAGGAKHLAVGILWSGIAGLIGAAGSLVGGSGAAGSVGGSGGRFGAATPAQGQPRIINQDSKPAVVTINVRAEPGVIVDHVIDDYRNNGRMRRLVTGGS